MRSACSARARRAFAFGASLPVALAPFLSLTGDAYEIGSILVTRLPPWTGPASRQLLRGDDLWLSVEVEPSLLAQGGRTASTNTAHCLSL